MAGRRYNQDDIYDWFQNSIDPKNRRIYLSSITFDAEGKEAGVDSLMAEFLIKGLELMKNNKRKIRIIMNNIGGDWFHSMAIYDAIRACPVPVDIEIYGHAMSMGAVILQAGRQRFMHPNSALMIHDGKTGGGELPFRSAQNWAKYEVEMCQRMYEIFAERSDHYKTFWRRKCSHDTILTPGQAVDLGLADYILKPTRALPCIKRKKGERKK